MNSFTLKMIAIITMLIDHTAVVLVPENLQIHLIMRCIGRLSFPIFCYLIVEGHARTKDVKKYMLRLGLFALISQIPFNLAIYGEKFGFGHQNVFFTLLIGLATIHTIDMIKKVYQKNKIVLGVLTIAAVYAGCLTADFIRCDYGSFGILLILSFYFFLFNKKACVVAAAFVLIIIGTACYSMSIESLGVISLAFIALYNGERGPRVKYVFYAFYPVHLSLLYGISLFVR